MFRKSALSLAALAVGAMFASAPAPAIAHDRTQGGVIPCSKDDYRFVQGRGLVSNCPRGGRVHGTRQGNTTTVYGPPRDVAVYRGSIAVPRGTLFVPRGGGPSIYVGH